MTVAPRPLRGYRFGTFEVDTSSASLRRGGLEVRLRGRPFDILLLLLESQGDIVTREQLKQRLWAGDTFVDFDHGLNAAMNRLRTALGDSAESPRFIQTLPRRGYRFLAPVERLERAEPASGELRAGPPNAPDAVPVGAEVDGAHTAAPPASRMAAVRHGRGWVWLVVGAAVVAAAVWGVTARRGASGAPARPMLAVLPFANLSGDAEQEYFSEGFTDELIAQLGSLNPERLGVIARTTVASYNRTSRSVAEIGRELAVQYILEGSVRRSGPRVRVTAELINVANQTQLWAETYDREVGDVLLTQRDVAMRVAEALTMSVLRTEMVPRLASPAAYEAVLRGRYLRQQGTEASLDRARGYFEQAIDLDPKFAPAYAGLADVFHVLGAPGWELGPPRDLLPRAREAAERAIALDPILPEGYAVRGMCRLWLQWDPPGAEEDLRHALALNASFAQAHQYLSTVHTVRQRFDEAVQEARRSSALDPLSAVATTTLGYRLYYSGRYAEAAREFDRALELAPDFASAWLGAAQTRRELGQAAESSVALEKAAQFAGGRDYVEAHLGYAEARAGNIDGARARLQALRTRSASRYVSPYHFALLAAGLGDHAAVRDALQHAFDDRSGWMLFVPIERELAPYRGDLEPLLRLVRPRLD